MLLTRISGSDTGQGNISLDLLPWVIAGFLLIYTSPTPFLEEGKKCYCFIFWSVSFLNTTLLSNTSTNTGLLLSISPAGCACLTSWRFLCSINRFNGLAPNCGSRNPARIKNSRAWRFAFQQCRFVPLISSTLLMNNTGDLSSFLSSGWIVIIHLLRNSGRMVSATEFITSAFSAAFSMSFLYVFKCHPW